MNYFVFRNNTIERFFPKGYIFSGYDDISFIPKDVNGYVWFYQLPIGFDESRVCDEVDSYSAKVSLVLSQISPALPVFLFTMDDALATPMTSGADLKEAIGRYNSALMEFKKVHGNVEVLDFQEFTRQYPLCELMDWKYWFISQSGLNPHLSRPFQEWFSHKLEQLSLKRKKCLVLDLDNTLWGGILGEDDLEGIKVGGDYPGKAYHLFQEGLLALSKTGVILTICSKNNEADVMEALEKNPFMILRRDSFAAWKINWQDKASNIRKLAEELNIGLDSMVFIDDNPSERELIRQVLPMVEVPEFPSQPYGLPVFFKDLVERYFRVFKITDEDRDKTSLYRANALRVQSRASFTDLESYIESLEIRIGIESANEFNIPRIAQMTQKTNQFNLTTRRYTETDIRSFLLSGWKIWCISVSDKFGDNGITGCIMIDGNTIDTLLLSCRILGKGIESAFVKSVLKILKDGKYESIKAQYIPSGKNVQVSDFYDRCGFKPVSGDESGVKLYSINLEDADLNVKPYYQITIK